MSATAACPPAALEDAFLLRTATRADPLSLLVSDQGRTCAEEDGNASQDSATPPLLGVQEFLDRALACRLLEPQELDNFLRLQPDLAAAHLPELLAALTAQGLLTEYQVNRLRSGHLFGMHVGNYRVLDRLGAGGMGVVYKAEHIYLRRAVALKVLVKEATRSPVSGLRFSSEMQALAALQHPNIVAVYDAGAVALPDTRPGLLHYLAMEYVPGITLDAYVKEHGPVPLARACQWICQAAQGLQHAHERGLIHRDINPTNLMRTSEDRIKLLDFGLAQVCRRRHTEAYTLLGTIDFVAPEQARDARSADIRADIYGLGGTLYWLLTGQKPFRGNRPALEELLARQRERPTPLRQLRPDLPPELEAVAARMLAHEPGQRYATPLAVLAALAPFVDDQAHVLAPASESEPSLSSWTALLVSPHRAWAAALGGALTQKGIGHVTVETNEAALAELELRTFQTVLIDLRLPNHRGLGLCHQLRTNQGIRKILITPPEGSEAETAAGQKVGADAMITSSLPPSDLAARLGELLQLWAFEDRAAQLQAQLILTVQRSVTDLSQAQEVLLSALVHMAELRGLESPSHLKRIQEYVRVIAEEAAALPAFAGQLDEGFVRMLERCAPLHDLGKAALPDHVLLKPGKLDAEERAVMESHTTLGAEVLAASAREHGAPLALLQMATDIARYHHERFDGRGYPEGLAGEAIPVAARFVTVADVYDALRSRLVYKPGLSHAAACKLILHESPGQFDPNILLAFQRCESSLAQIFAQRRD